MKIFKYRHKFAYGPGKWEYSEMNGYSKDQFAEILNEDYFWSDKYRGCEIEIVDAPKEFIEQALKDAKGMLSYYQERIVKLEKELKSHEKES